MPATRPRFLCLSSPRDPRALSVQPVPWHDRGAACVVQLCPMSSWDSRHRKTRVLCKACCKPTLLCHASSVTHAVCCERNCGFWVLSCWLGLLCRAPAVLPGSCKSHTGRVSLGDLQAEKDISSWKPLFGRTSCHPAPYLLGQPLQSCLSTLRRHGTGEGWRCQASRPAACD